MDRLIKRLRRAGWTDDVELTALASWAVAVLVIALHVSLSSRAHSSFTDYWLAGQRWLHGEFLYPLDKGYFYSPVAAGWFAPFAAVPPRLGGVVWRLLSATALVGAVFASGRILWPEQDRARWTGWALIALLPLALGNISNGQANVLVTALLLFAIIASAQGAWTVAAVAYAVAAAFKIYPLAVALLVTALYPRQLWWRLALALLALFLLSLCLQHPPYVLAQSHNWIARLGSDDRRLTGPYGSYRDAWLLLRIVRVPLTMSVWPFLQMAAGAGAAAFCFCGQRSGWSAIRCLLAAYCLGSAWMMLFGPATEAATYVVVAPAVVIGLLAAWYTGTPLWMRSGMTGAYGVLIAADALNSWWHPATHVALVHSVQPLGTLLFAGTAIAWFSTNELWAKRCPAPAASD